jgi:secreted PhoX family phosphatase
VDQVGQPLVGQSGALVPDRHDGTAAFAGPAGSTFLVRNQEQGGATPFPAVADAAYTYDPGSPGGTTTLQLDRDGELIDEYVSLAGTISNCAGGATPWGTWLSCEETESKVGSGRTRNHGYVFEVDPWNRANNATPTPLTALGRFPHEAAIIDPQSGDVYLTEDASGPFGLVYRCQPTDTTPSYGALRNGGTLHAMRCTTRGGLGGQHVPNLSAFSVPGTTLDVEWVPVPDPSAATLSTRKQFADTEVTRSQKFEGLWWGRGRAYIVVSFTTGVHHGQVWSYKPEDQRLRLEVFLALKDVNEPGEGPDNITVSPYGGLFLAEDGDGIQHLLAVDDAGRVSPFARNARDDSEFTGVCFSPDRSTMFANIQSPGVTFAITGPFGQAHG